MNKTRPATFLRAIVDHAEALRDAGVTEVSLDGCSFRLAPKYPDIKVPIQTDDDGAPEDPLQDGSLYPGGNVPGYDFDPDWRDA